MDVTRIPFTATVGICRAIDGVLQLPMQPSVHNHLNGIHASAQFALAETASGDALQRLFPELIGKVVPVVREAQIKFRRPAASTIRALPAVSGEEVARFREQFAKKQRATITVAVEVQDAEGTVTASAAFDWFVQGIPQDLT